MQTKIFNSRQIKKAAELIRIGELVAFPTETVYGLGANALDKSAVNKIFKAKGRPSENPLIVHISKKSDLHLLAKIEKSKENLINNLIDTFWPGPLTIVLKKKNIIPNEVSAGLKTVAIRMPKNKIALDLIEYSNCPIAAPSANISGSPSGTCFKHVFLDFNKKIAGIIKSKNCLIGLESTVIDLTSKKPLLLRPGGVSFEKLKKIIPDLKIYKLKSKKVKSPGMKYQHYSPRAKIILFELNSLDKIKDYQNIFKKQNKKIRIIKSSKNSLFARNLFKIFRKADKDKIDILLINSIKEDGIGMPIMNRLRKAAFKIVN